MRISSITRAVILGAAFFISAAGAAWEVSYESGAIKLSGLSMTTWPVGFCMGYEEPLDGSGGPD